MTYHQILNRTLELYQNRKYDEAYEFISANRDVKPGSVGAGPRARPQQGNARKRWRPKPE